MSTRSRMKRSGSGANRTERLQRIDDGNKSKIESKIRVDVNRAKTRLVQKALRTGKIWENFGQDEVRELNDKYSYYRYKPESKIIDEFDEWVSRFDDNDLLRFREVKR